MLHIFFAESDVVEVQTAELWQLNSNSITLKLALCFCLGSKSSSFLDLIHRFIVANE